MQIHTSPFEFYYGLTHSQMLLMKKSAMSNCNCSYKLLVCCVSGRGDKRNGFKDLKVTVMCY